MTLTGQEALQSKVMADESLQVPADALLSLSAPSPTPPTSSPGRRSRRSRAAPEGVFECKTCSKQFQSFQALGGHRTSHTRLQERAPDAAAGGAEASARRGARVYECAVCGLEFSMGQALGGHMRRHRGEAPPPESAAAPPGGGEQPEVLDLNYPPLEDGEGSVAEEISSGPQLLNLLDRIS